MFWFRVSSASGYDQSRLLTNIREPNFETVRKVSTQPRRGPVNRRKTDLSAHLILRIPTKFVVEVLLDPLFRQFL